MIYISPGPNMKAAWQSTGQAAWRYAIERMVCAGKTFPFYPMILTDRDYPYIAMPDAVCPTPGLVFKTGGTDQCGANDITVDIADVGSINTTTCTDPKLDSPVPLVQTPATVDTISIVWVAVTGATGYDLRYRKKTTTPWTTVTTATSPKAVGGLDAATTYEFQLKAKAGGNPLDSDWSASAEGTTAAS